MTDLTAPQLQQLARFDTYWRVVLAGDDGLLVRQLRELGYLDILKRRTPLRRLSEKGREALGGIG